MVVLMIDSDPLSAECVGLILRARKQRMVWARTVADAEQALRAQGFGMIVMDPETEAGKGMELLERIRADRAHGCVPVLVLTSGQDKAKILRIIELGVPQCMLKRDFSIRVLLERIERLARTPVKPVAGSQQEGAADIRISSPVGTGLKIGPGASGGGLGGAGVGSGHGDDAGPAEAAVRVEINIPPIEESIQRLGMLKPLIARSELSERLREVAELRALSPTVANVLRVVSRPESSIDSIVSAVRSDHAIALKIIKIANSSAYIRGEPVCSVKDAVVRIGTESIRQAVMNIGIIEQFCSPTVVPGLSIGQFWEHAIGVAILAAEIARHTRVINPDEAFTMGLLHDIGRILLADAIPEQYGKTVACATELSLPLEYVEKRMLLSTHADVAQDIFTHWGLPQNLIEPIVNHHQSMANIRSGNPRFTQSVAVIGLANRIAHAMRLGCSGNQAFYPTEDFFGALSIAPAVLKSLSERVPSMVQDLRFAMLNESAPSSPMDGWVNPRAVYLTDDPCDAVSLLFRERNPGEEHEPPNLAVVRIRTAGSRVPITTMLADTEKSLGVSRLPLIALSPKGNLTILENHLAGRQHTLLPLPTTTQRLRVAIDQLVPRQGAAAAA